MNRKMIYVSLLLLIILLSTGYASQTMNRIAKNHVSRVDTNERNKQQPETPTINTSGWTSSVSTSTIIDLYSGNFSTLSSDYEIGVIYENNTLIFYNYSLNSVLSSFTINSAKDAFSGNLYYIAEYNSSQGIIWFYNVSGATSFSTVKSGLMLSSDLDGDKLTDFVVWNATMAEVFFANSTSIVSKIIDYKSITADTGASLVGPVEALEINLAKLGKELVINVRGTSSFYSCLFKVNPAWLNYTIFYNSSILSFNTNTTVIIDLDLNDYYLDILIFESGKLDHYLLDRKLLRYQNNSVPMDYAQSKAISYTVDWYFRLRLFDRDSKYGSFIVRDAKDPRKIHFYYTSSLYEFSFTLDKDYTLDVGHFDGAMDDLLLINQWDDYFQLIPGESLVNGDSSPTIVNTITNVFSYVIYDMDHDGLDDLIIGENGYIVFHKAPQFGVSYFDGQPSGYVYLIKRTHINNDNVYDYLTAYTDESITYFYTYAFISDSAPPVIHSIKLYPDNPTARDSIVLYVNTTDNLYISFVVAKYTVYVLGSVFYSIDSLLLTKNTEGLYYTTLPPPQLFDILFGFTVEIDIYVGDIFGNFAYEVITKNILSYPDYSTYHDLGENLSGMDKAYSVQLLDVDQDNKSEIYFLYSTKQANSAGFNHFLYYADYGSPRYSFYNVSINTTLLGEPIRLHPYYNGSDYLLVVTYVNGIEIYSSNLTLIKRILYSVSGAVESNMYDYDSDGCEELFLVFNNKTLQVFNLTKNDLNFEKNYALSMVLNDTIFDESSNVLYGVYVNNTHTIISYLNMSDGRQVNLTNYDVLPAYTQNRRALGHFNGKIFLALSNGTLLFFNTSYEKKINLPNELIDVEEAESWAIYGNESLIVADSAGYIYFINSSLEIDHSLKVPLGAVPISIEYGDTDRDNHNELVVSYFENYLDIINLDTRTNASISTFDMAYVFIGDFDNYTGNEILYVIRDGFLLVNDLSKYYTVQLNLTNKATDLSQGSHAYATVSLKDLFGNPIDDATVEAKIETPRGITITQTLTNIGNGEYSLDISTDGWGYGVANVSIIVSHSYYESANTSFSILIRPILNIISDDYFDAIHGDSLVIRFDVRDDFGDKVDGAIGNVTIGSLTKAIYYNSTSAMYEAFFSQSDLLSLSLGEYIALINVTHPLAERYFVKEITVDVYSQLTLIANVTPEIINQGDEFNVSIQVFDAGGHIVRDADVHFVVNDEEYWGYNVTVDTDGWEKGNYTIAIYGEHDYVYSASRLIKWVVVYAIPTIKFDYDYVDAGIDEVVVEVRDIYDNLLTDVSVNISIENGVNLTLPGSGVYRARINFTNFIQKKVFNITIYVYNGSYVRNYTSEPYTIDVKLNVNINASITGESGLEYPLQGDLVTINISVYDQLGNPDDWVWDVEVEIKGTVYYPDWISVGNFSLEFSTSNMQYGIYEVTIWVYTDTYIQGYLTKTIDLVLLPDIHADSYEINLSNATTILKVYFYDKYGYTIDEANITYIDCAPLSIINLTRGLGESSITFNGTTLYPGKYNVSINVTWSLPTYDIEINKTYEVAISIYAPLRANIYLSPENSIIQGEDVSLNISVETIYGVKIHDAFLVASLANTIVYPVYSDGFYLANLSTSGFGYGNYSINIYIYHDYGASTLTISKEIRIIGKPFISYKQDNLDNKTTILYIDARDLYGNAFSSGEISVKINDNIYYGEITDGRAVIKLDLRDWEVGNYKAELTINGDYIVTRKFTIKLSVVSYLSEDNIDLNIPGLANSTSDYPEDAVVQGNDIYFNVTIFDAYNLPFRKCQVVVIFAGTQYYPYEINNNVFTFKLSTENMMSGHYTIIIQVSSNYLRSDEGNILTFERLIYIKPEIHYEIVVPDRVIEGQNLTIYVRLFDKYGNPLEPIENMTSIVVRINYQNYTAVWDEDAHAYVVTITAPSIDKEHVYETLSIEVLINYGKTVEKSEDISVTVMATSPITEQQIISLTNYIYLITLILTAVILSVYLAIRMNTFNEKLIKLFYKLILVLQISLVAATGIMLLMNNLEIAAFVMLIFFLSVFALYGLQLRFDQVKIIKNAYRMIMGEEEKVEFRYNLVKYILIYAIGAIAILVIFEYIGARIIWFSRFILGEYRTLGFIHDITLVTIAFYLFAARGMVLYTRRHFNDLLKNKLPAITYAESVEARLTIFSNLVEDSLKAMGSSTLSITIYTLYLIGTYIWGASRLTMLRINPITLVLLLVPLTVPIAIIWLLHFIRLPWEKRVERVVIT